MIEAFGKVVKVKKFLIFLIVPLLIIGCGKKQSGHDLECNSSCSGRDAQIPFYCSVRSLDPRVANDYPSAHIIRMLFDGLMRLGPDGEAVLAVAERYEISEDQKTYTFYLRDSKWTNGDPVTAYDFEYAWKKSVSPQSAQTGAYTFYTILNAAACLEGTLDVDQVGVKALDAKTLVVNLEHPAPYFLYLTCCSTFAPVNKKVDLSSGGWVRDAESFVSNGPFLLQEWKKDDFLLLKKNPRYWDHKQVRLSGINIQIVQDATTQFYLYEKGALDWLGEPFSPIALDIVTDRSLHDRLHYIESMGLSWFFLNTEQVPFTNKNFRKALSLSINRQELVNHVLQMQEKPATGILGSKLRLQEKPYFHDGDLETARVHFEIALKELDVSKEELGPLVVRCRSRSLEARIIQAIQEQWRKAFGIQVEIEQSDWPVHFSAISKGDFQIGEMAWFSWIADPFYMLETFRKRHLTANMSRWEHPLYYQYLDEADVELDQVKRKELFRNAEALLMEEMPIIPLYFHNLTYLKNPSLRGVYVSPLKEIDLKYAYFSSEED